MAIDGQESQEDKIERLEYEVNQLNEDVDGLRASAADAYHESSFLWIHLHEFHHCQCDLEDELEAYKEDYRHIAGRGSETNSEVGM